MKKSIIKHFIILFNFAVLVCGVLFGGGMGCQNTMLAKSCADYKAEWYNDELSFTTTGDRQDNVRYGSMVVNGERIEVIVYIRYTSPGFMIYAKSDFDGLEDTGKPLSDVVMENNIIFLFFWNVNISNGVTKIKIRDDNASERYGIPSRKGEEFELYRRDLTDEELQPSVRV